ncbi:coiled-coil domain-containing protein 42 homolog [Megalops cyprinoides]|uniref:coiled-coil domain-containing protein 42 homolog n=1 Tax=Megalops cyprinoides TaxID=118141 RepID=UPI0018649AE9|nr:coiled-coil domain-containing protein 42 homolog [Megalops cyprinoides]
MTVNLNDYFRMFYEDQLRVKIPLPEEGLVTRAARLLQKREELEEVERSLTAQKEEFQMRMERLRQRRAELAVKEEQLKESLLKFDKFVKENDSKCNRAKKKACADKELVRQKEQEIECLEKEIAVLMARKEMLQERVQRKAVYWEFLTNVIKRSKKFEEIRELLGRFDTLLATREQLLVKESEGQEHFEAQRLRLRRFVEEQSNLVLHRNNQLSALQTQLDQARSLAFKWETTWNHIQSTAAKETLLLGQIKVVTLNLFYMMGGKTAQDKGVPIDDTVEQLERIRLFIQDKADIVSDLRATNPDQHANTNMK